ncbi:hypothetical protein IPN35_05140 [Candidatus Peregrinibacteria bacterium]|nr:MAG: hypothetical protein IPN35_05140 [Candidatus Peregrinibacteria bacterium]
MRKLIHDTSGNAILIALAITSFLFIAAAGATQVIQSSLQQSPKLVNSGKAFYAAESAVESALYEASARDSGYEVSAGTTAGDAAFVPMNRINKTQANWTARSQLSMEKIQEDFVDSTQDHPYQKVLFIPPRKTKNIPANDDPQYGECADLTDNCSDTYQTYFSLSNWRPIRFGTTASFNLYSDISNKQAPLPMGGATNCNAGYVNVNGQCMTETLMCSDHSTPINGFCPENTKSIFRNQYGDPNNSVESFFIDLFIPGDFEVPYNSADRPLLSWRLEAKAKTSTGQFETVFLDSISKCDEPSTPGAICLSDFSGDSLAPSLFVQRHVNSVGSSGIQGRWVRILNPSGILKGGDQNFCKESFTNIIRMNYLCNKLIYNLAFPKLTLQLGKKPMVEIDSESHDISEAYVRVGFVLGSSVTNIGQFFQDFSLPDDKVTIEAVGDAEGFKQKVQVQIEPQELAPIFDYAIFQP